MGAVTPGQAAAAAGIQPGDRFVAIDDVQVNGDPERLRQELLSGEPGDDVVLTLERDGQTIRRTAELQELDDAAGRRTGLGFSFETVAGPTDALRARGEGCSEGLDFTWFVVEANVEVFGDVFTSQEAREQIASVGRARRGLQRGGRRRPHHDAALRRGDQPGARHLQPAADPAAGRRPHHCSR